MHGHSNIKLEVKFILVGVPEKSIFSFYVLLQTHTDASRLRNIGGNSFGFGEEKLYSTFLTCTVHSFVLPVIMKLAS